MRCEVLMSQNQISKFKLAEPVRTSCKRCGGPIYLTHIEQADYDKRTYECVQCGTVTTERLYTPERITGNN